MTITEAIKILRKFGYGVTWVPSLREWHVYLDFPPSDRRSEYLGDDALVAKAEELLEFASAMTRQDYGVWHWR